MHNHFLGDKTILGKKGFVCGPEEGTEQAKTYFKEIVHNQCLYYNLFFLNTLGKWKA